MAEKTIHHGKNIRRFRDMLGMNQDVLADALGEDWTQKKISLLEAKETIEPAILEQVAKALKVPVEAIENFDEEKAIINIQNNYDNAQYNVNYQFNPLEELMRQIEENKKLYEALLKEKDERIILLQNPLSK